MKTQKALILTLILALSSPKARAEVPHTEGFEYYKAHAYEITLALCKTDLDPVTLVAPLMGPPGELFVASRNKQRQQLYRFMWDAASDALSTKMDVSSVANINSVRGFTEFLNNDFPATRLSPEFVGLTTTDGYKAALEECYGNSDFKKAAFENSLVVADAMAKGLVLYGFFKIPEGFNAAGNKILATKFVMNHPHLLGKPVKAIMALPKAIDVTTKVIVGGIPLGLVGLTAGIKYNGDSTALPIAGAVTGLVVGGAAAAKYGWWGSMFSLATATIGGYFLMKSEKKPTTSTQLQNENVEQSLLNAVKFNAGLLKINQNNLNKLILEKAGNPSAERLNEIEKEIQKTQNDITTTKEILRTFCLDPRLKNSEDCKL